MNVLSSSLVRNLSRNAKICSRIVSAERQVFISFRQSAISGSSAPYSYSSRHSKVTNQSWAADRLEDMGEKLESADPPPLVEGTDELLSSPPQHVVKLVDEVLSLNVLEINQLLTLIQVSYIVQYLIRYFNHNLIAMYYVCPENNCK